MNASQFLGRRAAIWSAHAAVTRSSASQARGIAQQTIQSRPSSVRKICEWKRPFCSLYPKSPTRNVLRGRRYSSSRSSPDPTPHLGSPEPALSLSQRLKRLSREYGWAALGVYLGLSLLDFPFCFLAVRALGTDRIGRWEHTAIEWIKSIIPFTLPNLAKYSGEGTAEAAEFAKATIEKGSEAIEADIQEAKEAGSGLNASLGTQLALAYAVHKSLIFIRVPVTAAILPKVVKTLRKWGYDIGKRRPRPSPPPP